MLALPQPSSPDCRHVLSTIEEQDAEIEYSISLITNLREIRAIAARSSAPAETIVQEFRKRFQTDIFYRRQLQTVSSSSSSSSVGPFSSSTERTTTTNVGMLYASGRLKY